MTLVKQTFQIEGSLLAFDCYIISVVRDGKEEFFFTASDAARCLGYKRPNDAIAKNVRDEWKVTWFDLRDTENLSTLGVPSNWQSHTVFISEAGLYSLIIRSNKKEAIKFQKWMFEQVIPSIRQTGKFDVKKNQISNGETSGIDEEKNQLMLTLYRTERDIAVKDAQIAKLDAEISQKSLELARKELQHNKELYEEKLKVRELTTINKFVTIGYGAMGVVAESNISLNDELAHKLKAVVDRVVPSMTDQPKKEQYISCYKIGDNVKVTRCQHIEILVRDQVMKRMLKEGEEEGRSVAKKRKTYEIKYRWLKGAKKFHQVRCANPVMLWNIVKKSHMAYGFETTNKTQTEIRFLTKDEIRKKFEEEFTIFQRVVEQTATGDTESCTREEYITAERIGDLNLMNTEDAVSKCYTHPDDIEEKFKQVIDDALEEINDQLKVCKEAIRDPTEVEEEDAVEYATNRGRLRLRVMKDTALENNISL